MYAFIVLFVASLLLNGIHSGLVDSGHTSLAMVVAMVVGYFAISLSRR